MISHKISKVLGYRHGAVAVLVAVLAALGTIAFAGMPANASTRVEVKRMVVEEANNSRVPPSLALAVAKVESDFHPKALSPAGARGVMQIMPRTAIGEYGVDPDEVWDARLNIQLGIDFLERLIDRYGGRWDLALSHYNGGSVKGVSPHAEVLPTTRKYVEAVLKWQRRYAEQAAVWGIESTPNEGWKPAYTRVASAAERTVQLRPAVTVRVEWTPAENDDMLVWVASSPVWSEDGSLDDFDDEMELRRLLARTQLDDFATVITWIDG